MLMPFAITRQLPPIRRGYACARALDTTTITTTGITGPVRSVVLA